MVKTRWFPEFVKDELPSDVSGKVFVITGTTSGTGYIAAKTTAQLGGEVVMLNRASSRVTTMLENLKKDVPDGKFVTIECDLQDFASVQKATKEIKAKYKQIYCLSNNAGIMATPDRATVDGYDTQMQTNHLSHFLLTKELYPLLEKEAQVNGDARIVSHSSEARNHTPNGSLEEKYLGKNGGNLGGDKLSFWGGGCFERYYQTKLANAVFIQALHERLAAKDSKVRAICCDPGGSSTNLMDGLKFGMFTNFLIVWIIVPFFCQTSEDGTMGLLKAMMGPDAESGKHYGPQGLKGKPVDDPIRPHENNPESMKMLWETSERATGVTFNI